MGLLVSLITNSQKTTVTDDQGKWRQFILDHLDYIALRSQSFAIDASLLNIYRYDLKRFLKDYMNRHEDIAWIVQLLNNLPNDFGFVEEATYIIPTDDLILKLHQTYMTISLNVS